MFKRVVEQRFRSYRFWAEPYSVSYYFGSYSHLSVLSGFSVDGYLQTNLELGLNLPLRLVDSLHRCHPRMNPESNAVRLTSFFPNIFATPALFHYFAAKASRTFFEGHFS